MCIEETELLVGIAYSCYLLESIDDDKLVRDIHSNLSHVIERRELLHERFIECCKRELARQGDTCRHFFMGRYTLYTRLRHNYLRAAERYAADRLVSLICLALAENETLNMLQYDNLMLKYFPN